MTLLRADNLAFSYDDTPVLRGVSVSLAAGEVVALLGPNGSGKSTLLRCLLGHLPASGTIAWDDQLLAAWSPRDLARTAAYLPQTPLWDPAQSVREALSLGRSPYWGAFGLESLRDAHVLWRTAVEMELQELLARRMGELSGGQRQRVFLGRCLAQEPRAMLLDEPNTFLDLKHQVELARLLRRWAQQQGIGVLLASHDLNLAGLFADRLILLAGGRVMAEGAVADVLQPALLEQVYGIPMDRIDRDGKPPVVVMRM